MVKRILIVDDNPVNRKYARALLKADHLEISEVEDGRSAIAAYRQKPFDLILMDIQMPEMDGFECLKRLKAEFTDELCPILAVTAFSNDRERSEFIDAGFKSLVPKPIKPSELKTEVEQWLQQSKERQVNDDTRADSKSNGVIDFGFYQDLTRHIKAETLLDIYEEFERETQRFMEQLFFLVPAKNYPEILSILHTIKGNAGSLGIFILADHTRQMEGKLREGIYNDLGRDFDLLKTEFSNFVENYKRLLN